MPDPEHFARKTKLAGDLGISESSQGPQRLVKVKARHWHSLLFTESQNIITFIHLTQRNRRGQSKRKRIEFLPAWNILHSLQVESLGKTNFVLSPEESIFPSLTFSTFPWLTMIFSSHYSSSSHAMAIFVHCLIL